MLYDDLIRAVFKYFHIDSHANPEAFLLEIFDPRYKGYIEFDDDYLNQLRRRLSRTNMESRKARINCLQQTFLFNHQKQISFTHLQQNPPTSLPYVIVWLDNYFASPRDFRSMKRYLFNATTFDGPIRDPYWLEYDIDNMIITDSEVDFNTWNVDSHLKMFSNVDQCRDYIINQQDRSILLITSNENGQQILPDMHDRIKYTYVLSDFSCDHDWGYDYLESLQMFDDDQRMLTRVIQDLGRCVLNKASFAEPNEAWTYLNGAKKLYLEVDRAGFYRCPRCTSEILQHIDRKMEDVEYVLNSSNMNDDDTI